MSEEKAEQVQDSNVDSVADSAKEEATVTESEENVVVDNLTDDELTKRIQRANKEDAKFRVEKNEVEGKYDDLIQILGKALGFVEEDNANNADALADEVQKLQDENKNLKLMQAFNNVVTTEGADDELTWSYLMAKGELTEMDANDPELKAKLSEKIKAAIEVKPVLKSDLPPTVKKSGSDMSNESQPLDTESRIRQLEADKNFKEARLLKSSRLYEMTKEQQ
jgi:hypothetical protein